VSHVGWYTRIFELVGGLMAIAVEPDGGLRPVAAYAVRQSSADPAR